MFFLWLLLILVLILIVAIVLFVTSKIEIEIRNFKVNIPKIKNEFIDKKSKIIIKLYILNKFKILDIDINKTKLEKKKVRNQFEKFKSKLEEDKNNFDPKVIKVFKFLNVDFISLDLKIYLGQENPAITGILVGVIASMLSIFLRNKIKDLDKQKFVVYPVFQDKNILNIEINGIFEFKMRNIIYIIFKIIEKGKVMKNDRTSNRRTYAYGNE